MSLASYTDKFARLNVGRVGDHERPHKPAMLLALLDLFEQGAIKENKITYSPDLLELFGEYFEVVRSGSDQPTPLNPFFYLRGDKFWHHHPRPGQEAVLSALSAPPGVKALDAVSDHVFLDDELFALLRDPASRAELRSVLINRYFADRRDKVLAVAARESEIASYQRQIDEGGRVAESAGIPEAVRDTAFSRVVRRAYDYRCAACGRLVDTAAFNSSTTLNRRSASATIRVCTETLATVRRKSRVGFPIGASFDMVVDVVVGDVFGQKAEMFTMPS